MQFLLYKLADGEWSRVRVNGESCDLPLFEIVVNPRVNLEDLKDKPDPERVALISQALEAAQEDLTSTLWRAANELKVSNPDAPYLLMHVRKGVEGLCADEPPHPIYDKPGEWDDELEQTVYPDDAKIIGNTKAKLGWVLSCIIGLTTVPELPMGFGLEDVSDEFPFWIRPAAVPTDVMAYLGTPRGRAKLATSFGLRFGFGPAPEGAMAPTEMFPHLKPRSEQMATRLDPMYDRVLIKRLDATKESKGGIYIPQGAQEKNNLAIIVAVGPGYLDQATGTVTPLKAEPGMTIMIGKWAGDEIKVNGQEHLMIRENEIMAVVHQDVAE